jgi:hypothetical protein
LSAASTQTVTRPIATANGTATAGSDYTGWRNGHLPGRIHVADGDPCRSSPMRRRSHETLP